MTTETNNARPTHRIFAVTKNLVLSTAIGIAIGVGQIAWLLFRRRKIAALQWASVGLVIVIGSAAIITHDARFVMIKPSIGTFAIGCVMISSNWLDRYLPPIVTQNVSKSFTLAWSRGWGVFLFAIAAANLFTRNIYREFIAPDCEPRTEAMVAKTSSLVVKVGALIFIMTLPKEYASCKDIGAF